MVLEVIFKMFSDYLFCVVVGVGDGGGGGGEGESRKGRL